MADTIHKAHRISTDIKAEMCTHTEIYKYIILKIPISKEKWKKKLRQLEQKKTL